MQFSTAFKRAGFSKNVPSWISLVILVSSWYTIRPAPMFRCPTSEFPICPSGSPTAMPLAFPSTKGHSAISLSITGVLASATALPSLRAFKPYPSKIINTVGFFIAGLLFICYSSILYVLFHLSCRLSFQTSMKIIHVLKWVCNNFIRNYEETPHCRVPLA